MRNVLIFVVLFALHTVSGAQGTGTPPGGSSWQLVSARACVKDKVTVVEPVFGGGWEVVVYTRDTSNGDSTWYRNGVSTQDGPPVGAISQVSVTWEASGYCEYVFSWSGEGPAPDSAGFVCFARAGALFNDLVSPPTTGSGVVDNGYGAPAVPVLGPSGQSVVSEGQHFVKADVTNGVATVRTKNMYARAESSGSAAVAFAAVDAAATPDTRSISISTLFPNYRSTVVGHDVWPIKYLFAPGSHMQTYLRRDRVPTFPDSYGDGNSFKQTFVIGVPMALLPIVGYVELPFNFELVGSASVLGTLASPDIFSWSATSTAWMMQYLPTIPWAMPPKSAPESVTYVGVRDALLYSLVPGSGVISDLQQQLNSGNSILNSELKVKWSDGVDGKAESVVMLRPAITLDQSFGPFREIDPVFHNATGWNNPDDESVTINAPDPFTEISIGGSALQVAGSVPQLRALAVIGAILGLVGQVGEASVTPKEVVRDPISSSSKIWPDPAVVPRSWQTYHSGMIPPQPPLLSFFWMTQYQPAVDRIFNIYQVFDSEGYLKQILVPEDAETPLMVGGDKRTVFWHVLESETPPAWWLEG